MSTNLESVRRGNANSSLKLTENFTRNKDKLSIGARQFKNEERERRTNRLFLFLSEESVQRGATNSSLKLTENVTKSRTNCP